MRLHYSHFILVSRIDEINQHLKYNTKLKLQPKLKDILSFLQSLNTPQQLVRLIKSITPPNKTIAIPH